MKLMPLLGANEKTFYLNLDMILSIEPGSVYGWSRINFVTDFGTSVPYDIEELIKMINEHILS